jgi:SPP1 family phage portal protein
MDVAADDRAEYIQKDASPEFRKYVSELLINEIHKHSHVIDWYAPDTGMSGQVSAKALRTRLFDMDMYSQRIEKIYRDGVAKRIRLINTLMLAKKLPVDADVTIIYNRTVPSEFLDMLEAFKNVDFLSKRTIYETLGLDAEEELKRKEEENEAAMNQFIMAERETDEEEDDDTV